MHFSGLLKTKLFGSTENLLAVVSNHLNLTGSDKEVILSNSKLSAVFSHLLISALLQFL